MLTNAPSALQFISSLIVFALAIWFVRAAMSWFLKINKVLAHLRAIEQAVGVPAPAHAHARAWPLSSLRAKRSLMPVPVAAGDAANDAIEAAGTCPCCGGVLANLAMAQAGTNL